MRIERDSGLGIVEWETMSAPQPNDHSEPRTPNPELSWHQPVLVEQVIEWLAPRPGQCVVDCTVGMGGHSLAILPHLMPAEASGNRLSTAGTGRLVAIDCDAQALERAQARLAEFSPQVQFVRENFAHLPEVLARLGLAAVHGLVADLGLSSLHVDCAQRGFSFLKDGPLDMRMDRGRTATAASLIRELSEQELAQLLWRYGEERWSRRIAHRIVAVRRTRPIETTMQLARLVAGAVPHGSSRWRIHPATRTFLALRIAVNDELQSLEALLAALPEVLRPGGRAVMITFHSLEDRLVKQAFQEGARAGDVRVLTKKPIRPSEREVAENPRSRSAKLRAVERC